MDHLFAQKESDSNRAETQGLSLFQAIQTEADLHSIQIGKDEQNLPRLSLASTDCCDQQRATDAADSKENFDPPKKITVEMPDGEKLELNVSGHEIKRSASARIDQYVLSGNEATQIDVYTTNSDNKIQIKWGYYPEGKGPLAGPTFRKFHADMVETNYLDTGKTESYSSTALGWDTLWKKYYDRSGKMTGEGWHYLD